MKDVLIVFFMSIGAIAIGLLLFFFGPQGFHTAIVGYDREGAIPFTVIEEGVFAIGVNQPSNYRIKNQAELIELWGLVFGNEGPKLPVVSFETHDVLAIFDGSHVRGGFDISVTKISDENGKRVVHILRSLPGDACRTSPEVTSPFQILTVKQSTLPLESREMVITSICD